MPHVRVHNRATGEPTARIYTRARAIGNADGKREGEGRKREANLRRGAWPPLTNYPAAGTP